MNCRHVTRSSLFFFNDTATTEIYTLSLHDALPICSLSRTSSSARAVFSPLFAVFCTRSRRRSTVARSEEHTSELQSQSNLVCRLLLEKKKNYEAIPSLLYTPHYDLTST